MQNLVALVVKALVFDVGFNALANRDLYVLEFQTLNYSLID